MRILICDKNNLRLDAFLHLKFKKFSKNSWKELISKNKILINGKRARKSTLLKEGMKIEIHEFPVLNKKLTPNNLNIKPVYIDEHIVIYNKPKGLPTHPNKENDQNTLANQFIFDFKNSNNIGEGGLKSGLVHRLDNETSGLIIFARTEAAYKNLRNQFNKKSIYKIYLAVVYGKIKMSGLITFPIIHNKKSSKRMVIDRKSKVYSKTRFRRISTNDEKSLVMVRTFTGQMHQVRVHLHHIGHPLVGDVIYKSNKTLKDQSGHMLHAYALAFIHPITGKKLRFKVRPQDWF